MMINQTQIGLITKIVKQVSKLFEILRKIYIHTMRVKDEKEKIMYKHFDL